MCPSGGPPEGSAPFRHYRRFCPEVPHLTFFKANLAAALALKSQPLNIAKPLNFYVPQAKEGRIPPHQEMLEGKKKPQLLGWLLDLGGGFRV